MHMILIHSGTLHVTLYNKHDSFDHHNLPFTKREKDTSANLSFGSAPLFASCNDQRPLTISSLPNNKTKV